MNMLSVKSQGDRIERVRLKLNISREEMIEKMEIGTLNSYSSVINGNRNVSRSMLFAIARNLPNVNIHYIWTGKGKILLNDDAKNRIDYRETDNYDIKSYVRSQLKQAKQSKDIHTEIAEVKAIVELTVLDLKLQRDDMKEIKQQNEKLIKINEDLRKENKRLNGLNIDSRTSLDGIKSVLNNDDENSQDVDIGKNE